LGNFALDTIFFWSRLSFSPPPPPPQQIHGGTGTVAGPANHRGRIL
jgi:hypothetical protein